MNFLIRLRLCYPTFGCCRTHQYPSFARSAQTCCDRSSPLWWNIFWIQSANSTTDVKSIIKRSDKLIVCSTHERWSKGYLSFFVAFGGSVSRWRFGWLICVWLLFAIANHCLCQMNVLENRFSAIIRQSQQSTIATALLRSPLNCCDRSSPALWNGVKTTLY